MGVSMNLYRLAIDADAKFQAALVKAYGREAGNARYDWRNCSTPELKALRDASRIATAKHIAQMKKESGHE